MLGHEPFEFLLLPPAAWHVGHDLFLFTPPDILPGPFPENREARLPAPLPRPVTEGPARARRSRRSPPASDLGPSCQEDAASSGLDADDADSENSRPSG